MHLHSYHQVCPFFFFNDTATTEIYTLSLHDALPISMHGIIRIVAELDGETIRKADVEIGYLHRAFEKDCEVGGWNNAIPRSEEHTSELQSRLHLVCRLLLEKKKTTRKNSTSHRMPGD